MREAQDTKPYSKDLRLKGRADIARGFPPKKVAAFFGVSAPTVKRWLRRRGERPATSSPNRSSGPPLGRARHHEPPVRKGREVLMEAVGEALWAVTPQDVAAWFAHCGWEIGRQTSMNSAGRRSLSVSLPPLA